MKSFIQFLSESEDLKNIENYSIDSLKTNRGTIGTQGVTSQGLKNILSEFGEMKFDTNTDTTKILQQFKNDKLAQEKIISYVNKNPIELIEFPGGEGAAIKDGNHRAFLIHQTGQTTIPATVKRPNIPNPQTTPTITPKLTASPRSPKLPKALGVAGAILGLAAGANADTIAHSLHPLSVLDSGSLGTDDMMGEPIEFKEPAPKQQKPLPGAQFMFSSKKIK